MHATAALSDAVARLQSLSVDFRRQEDGYAVAKSREMLGEKRQVGPMRSSTPERQSATAEVQVMAAELQKKADRLKEAKAAVSREKLAASVAKNQAKKMRRELQEVGVNLDRERAKREVLQQANERLKWKLDIAERRADDVEASAIAGANGSFRSVSSMGSQRQPPGHAAASGRRRTSARGATLAASAPLAQPKGGRGTLKAKPPTLQRLDLHQAASAGDCVRIMQLLDGGWHVDGLNAERETPLHWAANLGQSKAVQLLLSRQADPTLKDRWNHTPSAQARNKGHFALADMLEDGEDRWEEIKEEEEAEESLRQGEEEGDEKPWLGIGAISSSRSRQAGPEEVMLQVFVSHNRGEPLEWSLPRNTTYSQMMELLMESLCDDGGDVEELLYIDENGDAIEMLDEDFEELVGPHVPEPYLQLQAVVSDSGESQPRSDSGWEVEAAQVGARLQQQPESRAMTAEDDEAARQARLEEIQQEVPHWSTVDVETWLVEVVQLPQYIAIFRENEVDGELLLWLRELNLQEDLEITSLLHRKRIAAQIDLLRPPSHQSAPLRVASLGDTRPHSPATAPSYGASPRSDAAAQLIQTMWRGHATRTKYGQPVDIIRRFEQLKSGAADEPDEQDLAEEVRSELAFIGEQLREQLANSKAQPTSPERPSSALSELREFNSELESNSVRSSPPPQMISHSPALVPAAVAAFDEVDSPGFLPRPDAQRLLSPGLSPALLPATEHMSRRVTEIEGNRLSVTIYDQGKLGLNFGSSGVTWPVVESIALDGLVAHHPELTADMRLVGVNGQKGSQDVTQLSFKQATVVFRTAGRPVTLIFAKVEALPAAVEPSVVADQAQAALAKLQQLSAQSHLTAAALVTHTCDDSDDDEDVAAESTAAVDPSWAKGLEAFWHIRMQIMMKKWHEAAQDGALSASQEHGDQGDQGGGGGYQPSFGAEEPLLEEAERPLEPELESEPEFEPVKDRGAPSGENLHNPYSDYSNSQASTAGLSIFPPTHKTNSGSIYGSTEEAEPTLEEGEPSLEEALAPVIVTCPENAREGEQLIVTVDGQDLEIAVPVGVCGGDEFEVHFE